MIAHRDYEPPHADCSAATKSHAGRLENILVGFAVTSLRQV